MSFYQDKVKLCHPYIMYSGQKWLVYILENVKNHRVILSEHRSLVEAMTECKRVRGELNSYLEDFIFLAEEVESSNIACIILQSDKIVVLFKNNTLYKYSLDNMEKLDMLLSGFLIAESKGKYFNQYIKSLPFKKLEG